MIRAALDRLTAEGIAFATRGDQPIDAPPPGGDVDILVHARDARAAERVLEAAGFHRLAVAGHRGHRFHLAFDPERARWLKLDLNLVPTRLRWDLDARDERSLRRFAAYRVGAKAGRGTAERVRVALLRRLPLAPRRRGPVIALLGPDGAGKGSVITQLRAEIPVEVTAIYMGNGEASSAGRRAGTRRARMLRAAAALLPAGPRLAQYRLRRALRAARRAWVAHAHAWRGDVVLCDRHPLEALALEPDAGGLGGRVGRLVPWPDEIVVLDAPGELLFTRKGEHTPERLEQWRRAYQSTFEPLGASIVPTTGDLTTSVAAVSAIVWRALRARRGW
jgi:thymidylate kinase